MEITLLDIVMEVNPVQSLKAWLPIEIKLLGIVTVVIFEQP